MTDVFKRTTTLTVDSVDKLFDLGWKRSGAALRLTCGHRRSDARTAAWYHDERPYKYYCEECAKEEAPLVLREQKHCPRWRGDNLFHAFDKFSKQKAWKYGYCEPCGLLDHCWDQWGCVDEDDDVADRLVNTPPKPGQGGGNTP